MFENSILLILLLPILIFLGTAFLSGRQKRLPLLIKTALFAGGLSLFISLLSLIQLIYTGTIETSTLGINGLGFSIRLDPLSLIMYSMISIIALVVIRFSINYLDGDANQNTFLGKLALTIACVQLLVLSGNTLMLFLMWIATSMSLHQLLIFYPNRFKARIAARKKFILARIGDLALLGAITLIYMSFNTGNLTVIFDLINNSQLNESSLNLEIAAGLLVLTAGLKSVQIPFHGWILEVMETPTPVSALLHAGLLNAGPFLMIRFAYLLDAVNYAPIALLVMGTCTAIFGALVFNTQPTIKTALAYSSIGHMGFTLMLSGLGLYSASLLHLTAHSFYKAYAFLSSGSIIDQVQTSQARSTQRKGNVWNILFAFLLAIVLYTSIALIWNLTFGLSTQLLIVGGILFAGVASLTINTIDSNNNRFAILRLMTGASFSVISFFVLEELMRIALGSTIPTLTEPSLSILILSCTMLAIFSFIVISRAIRPAINKKKEISKWHVHLRNGLYLNVLFDRLISSLQYKN